MDVTFLIGNGFDRNLGLETSYSEFVNVYKSTEGTTETLKNFRKHIKDNEKLWSVAEIELGQYTSKFGVGEAEKFTECQIDFCGHLTTYLKDQESRINYSFSKENIKAAFKRVNKIISGFPTQEREILNEIYKKRMNEITLFNFICFNYTDTLDKCLDIVKQSPEIFGKHVYNGTNLNHGLGNLIHVHGTVDKDMIFGVNDETQISKIDIFDCDDGDLYKSMLIKQSANETYLENTDAKTKRIVEKSNIIYIYGMSIGETDKLWWERICKWLSTSNDHHLIIQKYEMPLREAFPIKNLKFERQCKKEFAHNCNLESNVKDDIEKRIHIIGENIFEDIKNIAEDNPAKNAHAKVEQLLSI